MPGLQAGQRNINEVDSEQPYINPKTDPVSPFLNWDFFDSRLKNFRKQTVSRDPYYLGTRLKTVLLAVPKFVVNWFKVYEPRWRTSLALILLVAIVFTVFFANSRFSQAATHTFVQSDWCGGASSNSAVHPGDQTAWDEYNSQSNIDTSTCGTIKASNSSTTIGDITTGLRGHWKFDEGSGTTASDSSGNNSTGTLVGTPAWTSGQSNGALTFDRIDDGVSLIDADYDMSGTNAFTISAWIYPSATSAENQTIFVRGNVNAGAANNTYSLFRPSGGNNLRSDISNGLVTVSVTAVNAVTTDTWQHVAVVWDGTNDSLTLYKNGVSIASDSSTINLWDGDSALKRQTGIGYRKNTSDQFFNGNMDEVRVYSRALNNSDIKRLMDTSDVNGGNSESFGSTVNKDSGNTTAAINEPGHAQAVQFATNSTTASQNTVAVTVSATGAGKLIIVGALVNNSLTVTSVTDNIGNTYVQASNAQITSGGLSTDMWYVLSASAGVTTVTVTYSATDTSTKAAGVWEITGLNSVAFDTSGTSSGTLSLGVATGAALTTSGSNGFAASIFYTTSTTSTFGTNVDSGNEFAAHGTRMASNAGAALGLIYKSAGSHQAKKDGFGTGPYISTTVAFKETASASTTTLWDGSGQLTGHHGQVVLDDIGGERIFSNTTGDVTDLTVGSGSNRALVVGVSPAFVITSAVTSVVWDPGGANQSLTLIGKTITSGGGNVELWGLVNPVSGNKTLTVTMDTSQTFLVGASAWSGVDQTGGTTTFYNFLRGVGSGENITVTSAVGDVAIGFMHCNTNVYNYSQPRAGLGNHQQLLWGPGNTSVLFQIAAFAACGDKRSGVAIKAASINSATQSLTLDATSGNIGTATLTKNDTPGTGSVTYYLSNNGGTNWGQVTPGTPYTFATTGSDLRFKIELTSGATVQDVTISYTGYATAAELTSNVYNTSDANNLISKLAWTATGTTGSLIVKFQIRTAPDSAGAPGTWSAWCGYENCSGTDYFDAADNDVTLGSSHDLRTGGDDQWLQYKVFIVTDGSGTPTLTDVTISYVVNSPPDFETDYPTAGAGGVIAEHRNIFDISSSNWGKVFIDYRIRDTDTTSGTSTPGFVTPSFEYNIGGGWVAITAGNLEATDLNNKAVDVSNYTFYRARWNAAAQIPDNYLTTAQIRVTVNDNEGANNTAQATTADFTLDTRVPVITAFTINATSNTLTITASDDSNVQYMLSNNSDFTADGVNATSGQWQDAGGNSINLTPAWTLPADLTVYLKVRDLLNNTTSTSAKAPVQLTDMSIHDISNVEAENYREFISWSPYTNVADATFSRYELYRSTDGSSFSSLANITDIDTNYYANSGLATGTTYYYKVRVLDTGGDLGNFSAVVSDNPDGQGGTDTTPPTITSVTVAEAQATYARITWTTDELADTRVDYSISPSTAFDTGQTHSSFVTSHTITLTGLTPNTNYLFRAKSADIIGNTGTNDNSAAGFSFTTTSGPVISNVTETMVNENSATIFWNTDVDSDSYVSYSTNPDLSSSTRVGSATLASQHSVTLTGLGSGTIYYYFVESTDALANTSFDKNGNNYYTFTTTTDTVAPVISNIQTPVIAPTAGVVVWQTNEPATTQLNWGTTSGDLSNTTTLDSTLTIFHVVSLTGLTEDTEYFFRSRSKDSAANETIADEDSFTTGETTIIQVAGSGGGSSVVLDTTAPNISGIKAENVTSFKATVSFATDEDTVGFVQFGKEAEKYDLTAGGSEYAKTHSINLAGLQMGTEYHYRVRAVDKGGNVKTSDALTFKTEFFTQSSINIEDAAQFEKEIEDAIASALPSLTAPFIERPQATEITDSSAKITWRTNVKAYSVVAYSTDDEYNSATDQDKRYATEISNTSTKVTDHELILTNLNPNTRYHFQVKAFTLPQLVGKSNNLTFVTKALNIQAQITNIANTSFRVAWRTNEPTTSVVDYKNTATGVLNQKAVEIQTTDHQIIVDSLTPATTYEVSVYGINSKGNRVQTASAVRITTSKDVASPEIQSLKIDTAIVPGRNDRTQTIISWKTNEPSTSTVYYEEGAGSSSADAQKPLSNKVEITNSYVLDHAVVLSVLKPGGLYRIQVSSTDNAGNISTLPVRTIVIPRQSESILDVVFKNFEDTFKFLRQIGR